MNRIARDSSTAIATVDENEIRSGLYQILAQISQPGDESYGNWTLLRMLTGVEGIDKHLLARA